MGRDFWAGRRVLVTGHTGFIGGWLCHALAALDAEVAGYANDVPTSPSLFEATGLKDRLDDCRGDITDLSSLLQIITQHKPSIVFHLAAQPLVRTAFVEPIRTYKDNLLGTVTTLEAIRSTPSVDLGVMMTTDKVYQSREDHSPHREGDQLGGTEPYGLSKAMADMAIAQYRASYFTGDAAPGKRIVAVRAGNVIGGGDWAADRLVPDAIRAWSAGEAIEIRSPHATRPWQHVLDVVGALLLLAERGLSADGPAMKGAYNVGPDADANVPVSDLVEGLAAAWGDEAAVNIAKMPPSIPEAKYLSLDSSLFRGEHGWRPRLDLRTAIGMSVDWYRQAATGQNMRELTEKQLECVFNERTP